MNKKEIIAKLVELGIPHDESMKKDELFALLPEDQKGMNKEGDTSKVVFTRKDGSTRVFCAADHGEDFVAVADEFAKTNEQFIAKREDVVE